MNDYEKLRMEFVCRLQETAPAMTVEQEQAALRALDMACTGYAVQHTGTALTVRSGEMPDIVKQYLVSGKISGLSVKTLDNRRLYLSRFCAAIGKPVTEATAMDVRVYLYDYQRTRGVSDRSLEQLRSALSAFYAWAVDNEIMQRNPCKTVGRIRYEYRQREALDMYELEQLRGACRDLRETAMIEFMYSTGCRVSELCGVKLADIDWHDGSVKLFGKGKKERVGYFNAKALVSVRRYLVARKYDSEYLFASERAPNGQSAAAEGEQLVHGGLTAAAVEKAVRVIVARLDGAVAKRITPHILRHTMATQALKCGMPIEQISQLLGHSDVAVTRIYAESCQQDIKAAHEKYVV